MREWEGVDLVQLKQEHLDASMRGLLEVERLYWEGHGAGGKCGLLAWNGMKAQLPVGGQGMKWGDLRVSASEDSRWRWSYCFKTSPSFWKVHILPTAGEFSR
jgi:hypothetical protein